MCDKCKREEEHPQDRPCILCKHFKYANAGSVLDYFKEGVSNAK